MLGAEIRLAAHVPFSSIPLSLYLPASSVTRSESRLRRARSSVPVMVVLSILISSWLPGYLKNRGYISKEAVRE